MAQKKQSNLEESLVSYVTELRDLNDSIKITPIKADIKAIIENPEQYALDLIEANFVGNIKKFIKAHKMGNALAKKILNED